MVPPQGCLPLGPELPCSVQVWEQRSLGRKTLAWAVWDETQILQALCWFMFWLLTFQGPTKPFLLVRICANCSLNRSSPRYLQMRMCCEFIKASTGPNTSVNTQGGGEEKNEIQTVLCPHSKTKLALMHWKNGDMKLCILDVHKG